MLLNQRLGIVVGLVSILRSRDLLDSMDHNNLPDLRVTPGLQAVVRPVANLAQDFLVLAEGDDTADARRRATSAIRASFEKFSRVIESRGNHLSGNHQGCEGEELEAVHSGDIDR